MPNVMLLLFWLASALLPLPMFIQHLARLWQIDQYQYFPVLMLTVAVLAYIRWDKRLSYPNSRFAWMLLAMGWLVSIAGSLVNSPWSACVGLILVLGSWFATHVENRPAGGSLLHLWFPTWMLVRLPFGLDIRLTNTLQQVTSIVSSELFNSLGIPHTRNGNVFELPSGAMLVEEACSGVQSLFSLLFCAFMLVAWLRRGSVLLPMYAVAAIGSALIMNVVRVIAIGVAQEWYSTDLAHGVAHEVLGYICLGLAILMLASADCLLRVLFFPVPESVDDSKWNPILHVWNLALMDSDFKPSSSLAESYSRKPPPPKLRTINSGFAQKLAVGLCVVAVCCWVSQVANLMAQPLTRWEVGKERFWAPDAQMFSAIEGLTLTRHEVDTEGNNPVLGENADSWDGQFQGLNIQIVLSQPYPEFHDLLWCYTGKGWEQTSRIIQDHEQWKYVTCSFVKPPRQFGYSVYGGLGRDGLPVGPLEMNPVTMVKVWFQWRNRNAYESAQGCQMLQLFTQTEEPLSREQTQALNDLYIRLRNALRTSYSSAIGKQVSN